MNSAIPSTCMDRYLSRYIVPPHPVQQHQQQLLNPQANQNVPAPNGYYAHQLLHQQHQQQPPSHAGPPHNFMVGCYNNASGWTGVPLISTAARRPRKFQPINTQNAVGNHYQPSKTDFDETAMSRLAMHAHGAPLILNNNRYRSSKSNGNSKPNKVPSNHASREDHSHHPKIGAPNHGSSHFTVAPQHHTESPVTAQTVNDECGLNAGNGNNHSTSSSSDTCLPRIIKPRKRRKKDRKPNVQNNAPVSSATPTAVIEATSVSVPNHVSNSLLLDETTRDFLHEIALLANAGGTFDFGGIPLMHSDAAQPVTHQLQQQQQQQQQQTVPQTHFSSSNSDSSDSGINNLACSCRLCDPFGKIWAFPLRRSCSDNSAEIELNRAKDVGVIGSGSNRSNSFRSEWRSSPHSLDQQTPHQQQMNLHAHHHQQQQHQHLQQEFGSGSSRKGSFSDSGDSGCDLLSGLTFCSEDILSSVNRELFLTPVDGGKEFKFPTTSGGGGVGCIGNGSANSISGSGSPGSVNSVGVMSDNSELLLISELTKKLNEGLDLGGRTSVPGSGGGSEGGSVFSDGVFGDGGSNGLVSAGTDGSSVGGGPDLFVNFDAISRNNLFSANNISKLSNLLFDDSLTAPGLVINSA